MGSVGGRWRRAVVVAALAQIVVEARRALVHHRLDREQSTDRTGFLFFVVVDRSVGCSLSSADNTKRERLLGTI